MVARSGSVLRDCLKELAKKRYVMKEISTCSYLFLLKIMSSQMYVKFLSLMRKSVLPMNQLIVAIADMRHIRTLMIHWVLGMIY